MLRSAGMLVCAVCLMYVKLSQGFPNSVCRKVLKTEAAGPSKTFITKVDGVTLASHVLNQSVVSVTAFS
jgi:hypothetical protein